MDHDEKLIRNILNGDENSLKILIENYQAYIFAIIFNITHNKHETESIAQETFIQAYRSLSNYRFNGFKSWISRIATNKAIDWKRKNIQHEKIQKLYQENISILGSYKEKSAEENLIEVEKARELLTMYTSLPHKYKTIIHKYYFQSKSYKEIAKEENISLRTVESRLYRAKQLMKNNYKEGG